MKLIVILGFLLATVYSIPLGEKVIEGKLRVIPAANEEGEKIQIEPTKIEGDLNKDIEETETDEETVYIDEDGKQMTEKEFNEKYEKGNHTSDGGEDYITSNDEDDVHENEKDAEKPPVEEEDEHEDAEGPTEEPITEPKEKILPEEEHLIEDGGSDEHVVELGEDGTEEEVIPPWELEKMTEEERKEFENMKNDTWIEEDEHEEENSDFTETEGEEETIELPHEGEEKEEEMTGEGTTTEMSEEEIAEKEEAETSAAEKEGEGLHDQGWEEGEYDEEEPPTEEEHVEEEKKK